MAIITSRADAPATVSIDESRCTNCGMCAAICPTETLRMDGGVVVVERNTSFGCIGCGQCMAVCPADAVAALGRCLSPEDMAPLPAPGTSADGAALGALLERRRSIRHYTDEEVDRETVDRIVAMAATAPMGIPPSEVGLVVFHGREKVHAFAEDMIELMRGGLRFFRSPFYTLMSLTMGKAQRDMMDSFVLPMTRELTSGWDEGRDLLLYDAPLAVQFYGPAQGEDADHNIAATYAMLAAESLGLGTCLIGSVSPFLIRDKLAMQRLGLPPGSKPGLVLIAGHPRHRFRKTVRRTFADVRYA